MRGASFRSVVIELLAILPVLIAAGSAARGDPACSPAAGRSGRVVAIGTRLEIALADGSLLRLAGVEPAQATPDNGDLDAAARASVADRLAGRTITYRALAGAPDRWGRLPVTASGADGSGSLAEAIVAAGLARVMPEPAAHGCRASLLAAETAARTGRKGLWADPYYAVLAPDDAAGLLEHAGGNAIVQGKLTAVQPGPVRMRLTFGAAPGGFTVTLLQRNVRNFETVGIRFRDLVGRILRIRGLLDTRFGPQIEITNPDEIEVIDESDAAAGHATPSPR